MQTHAKRIGTPARDHIGCADHNCAAVRTLLVQNIKRKEGGEKPALFCVCVLSVREPLYDSHGLPEGRADSSFHPPTHSHEVETPVSSLQSTASLNIIKTVNFYVTCSCYY